MKRKLIVGVAVLYILFISAFALDVFEQPQWPVALLIHLLPSLVLTIGLVVSRKHKIIGGLIFIATAVWLLRSAWMIWLPPLLIGILLAVL